MGRILQIYIFIFHNSPTFITSVNYLNTFPSINDTHLQYILWMIFYIYFNNLLIFNLYLRCNQCRNALFPCKYLFHILWHLYKFLIFNFCSNIYVKTIFRDFLKKYANHDHVTTFYAQSRITENHEIFRKSRSRHVTSWSRAHV